MDTSFNGGLYPRSPFQTVRNSSYQAGQQPRSLIEAIDCNAPICFIRDFILQNPDSVHDKGFIGLQPLHKAVLLGNENVVTLLLQHKADPNCRNDINETPFLLSCRQGFVTITHQLVQKGGDIYAKDKLGRGALQFASQGGSVLMLHYLHTVHGLSLACRDNQENSLLHVTATQGQPDALMYLLRNNRCDIYATNEGGYTALHCAAQAGLLWISWCLLEQANTRLLHMLTHEGYTAADLAKKGSSCRHKETYQMLNNYSSSKFKGDEKIRGPVLLWYWHLMAPFVLYFVSLCLSTYYNGYVMIVGAVVILLICAQQGHRVRHTCRWANPMYSGMFAAGLIYTSMCYILYIFPTLSKSNSLLSVFSIIIIIVMDTCYVYLLWLDPGVQTSPHRNESGEDYTIVDVVQKKVPLSSYCTACEFVQKPFTKHCKLCQRCHTGMDHHCLFLYRCIAQNNHRNFIRFILTVMLAILMFEYQAVLHLMTVYPGLSQAATDYYWQIIKEQPFLWSAMISNCLSFLWGLLLLRFQLKFISLASTQYFQIPYRKSNLSVWHRFCNIMNFLFGKKYYAKDSGAGVILL